MKFVVFVIATIALIAIYGETAAFPQRAKFQTLPYRTHRQPQQQPRPIRVRRGVAVGGIAASNPTGGVDTRLEVAKGIGTPEHNVIASGFAEGNTKGGPVTTGGTLSYNINDVSASISKSHTPGISDTLTKSVQANLFKSDTNRIDAQASKSETKLNNGFDLDRRLVSFKWNNAGGHGASISKDTIPDIKETLTKQAHANLFNNGDHNIDAKLFDTRTKFGNAFNLHSTGGGFDWSHRDGYGANIGLTNVHDFGKKLDVGAYTNLFTSNDRKTSLDLNGSASRWLNGPFSGQNDYGFGLGLTHRFGWN